VPRLRRACARRHAAVALQAFIKQSACLHYISHTRAPFVRATPRIPRFTPAAPFFNATYCGSTNSSPPVLDAATVYHATWFRRHLAALRTHLHGSTPLFATICLPAFFSPQRNGMIRCRAPSRTRYTHRHNLTALGIKRHRLLTSRGEQDDTAGGTGERWRWRWFFYHRVGISVGGRKIEGHG